MNLDDLKAFARRDWAGVERGKWRYWADRYHQEGSEPARRAATLLLAHARRLGHAGLTEQQRSDDFAHHVEMRDQLDRAACALTRR